MSLPDEVARKKYSYKALHILQSESPPLCVEIDQSGRE